jgi:hypothetical protein
MVERLPAPGFVGLLLKLVVAVLSKCPPGIRGKVVPPLPVELPKSVYLACNAAGSKFLLTISPAKGSSVFSKLKFASYELLFSSMYFP